ncbi:hypothetical protein D3C71_1582590 [compost metagenome]
MFERRPAVEPDAGDAGDGEIDGQHIALFAGGKVCRCMVDGVHRAVREGGGVEGGGVQRGTVEPEADRVLADHGHLLQQRMDSACSR